MSSSRGLWGRVTNGLDLLPASRQGRAALVWGVVLFLVLDVLVVLGSELALGLLVLLTGLVAGLALARLSTLPVRRTLERGGPGNLFVFLAGLASMFVIVFLGTDAAGIPAYPTAEGGHLGTAIYGFAFGFGVAVCVASLRPPAVPSAYRGAAAKDGTSGILLRTSFVLVGVVVGLFGLLFVAFLLLEYVLAPLVRLFAS